MNVIEPAEAIRQGFHKLDEQMRHRCKHVGGTDECLDRDDDPRYIAPLELEDPDEPEYAESSDEW